MIDVENSSYNGWYFEKMVDGEGEGICENCGDVLQVTKSICLNLKPCKCGEE